jgi:hypothetical protein
VDHLLTQELKEGENVPPVTAWSISEDVVRQETLGREFKSDMTAVELLENLNDTISRLIEGLGKSDL